MFCFLYCNRSNKATKKQKSHFHFNLVIDDRIECLWRNLSVLPKRLKNSPSKRFINETLTKLKFKIKFTTFNYIHKTPEVKDGIRQIFCSKYSDAVPGSGFMVSDWKRYHVYVEVKDGLPQIFYLISHICLSVV